MINNNYANAHDLLLGRISVLQP